MITKDESKIPKEATRLDIFSKNLSELFFIENPHYKKDSPEVMEKIKSFSDENSGNFIWVYYPWNNIAVKTVPEDLYFKLRTSRNRFLITEDEQFEYRNLKVGIAGLSVGSGILSALIISGGPKYLKIADFDEIEVTNLNRISARLIDVGSNKSEVAAHQVWDLDPFADIDVWSNGINKENLKDFLLSKNRLDVFIDEMDSIDMKILSRIICRENRIPVMMATDNGDTVIFDIERFDIEPGREIFHGLAGNLAVEDCNSMTREKWLRLSTQIIGPEFMTPELQSSILKIGKDIGGVPQLGTTARIAGAAASLGLRRIASKKDMPSGRYIISLEEKIEPDYNSKENIEIRNTKTTEFKSKLFGSK